MRYLGGKNRLGKEISQVLKEYGEKHKLKKYIEPFCGSLGVAIHMVDDYNVHVSDIQKDLILLWKAIQNDTFKYPRNVSKRTWLIYKNSNEPSAIRAFIGFGCSFAGSWFAGYSNTFENRNYMKECKESIIRKSKFIKKIKKIKHQSYEKWNPTNCLIYCDVIHLTQTQLVIKQLIKLSIMINFGIKSENGVKTI